MINKLKLYFISLALLFIFIIVVTIDIPFCFQDGCSFIGFKLLFFKNWFSLICLVCFFISLFFWFDFKFKLKGSTSNPFKAKKVENVSFEHLTFLATYIVPLISFNFDSDKFKLLFTLLIFVIGIIYLKTNLFYANPSLALMGYSIYKVDADFRDGAKEGIIVLSLNKIEKDSLVTYIKLDENVYFGRVLNG
ncbi:anti-phage protein KwaA [Acinetobacter courvalinii]|uniref:anti-phage protein KwaA n=1 Tax=Acinetobacter courvalinii TaxID=280147 RepID=UPI0002CF83EC|nr:anti-phage protein KwaA [Acinetobacter courvalinii]ENX07773.1 hypothetical protein F898_01293 [Acinetobacter courvalinii]